MLDLSDLTELTGSAHDDDPGFDAPPGLLLAVCASERGRLAAGLRGAGYRVDAARDLEHALALLAGGGFAAAVVDLSGFGGAEELAGRLAETEAAPECVLLAEPGEQAGLWRLYDADLAYNHLWKPLRDAGDVARMAGRAVEKREMRLAGRRLAEELRDARQERRGVERRLERLDRAAGLDRIAAAVLSRLDGPLLGLSAYAEYIGARLARSGPEPLTPEQVERMAEYLGAMREGAEACRAAARAAREYAGERDTPPGPISLHAALEDAMQLIEPDPEPRGAAFTCRLMDDPPPVFASPGRLRHVLFSLLRNAAEAAGGVVCVSTEPVRDRDGDALTGIRVRITDDGPGLTPEARLRAFEPFFTTRDPDAHLGMGLTLARRFARAWRGDLTLTPAPRHGTSALLTLRPCESEAARKAA